MYHEEKIINGVLHFKSTPRGKWVEFSKLQLMLRIEEKELNNKVAEDLIKKLEDMSGESISPEYFEFYTLIMEYREWQL